MKVSLSFEDKKMRNYNQDEKESITQNSNIRHIWE